MQAPTLSSRITDVTVFRRGALITRTATLVGGPDGFPASVRLEGLPLLLDDESLQLELHSEGEGTAPLAGDLRVTLAIPEPDAQLRAPTNEELEAAALERSLAVQAQADLELLEACVSGLSPAGRGIPAKGQPPLVSPTEARLGLLAWRRARLEQLAPRLKEAAERTRVARERLETLQERERRASQARNPRTFEARKAVVVGLLSTAATPTAAQVELRLRYFVPGARWAPSYVLRLDPLLGGGTLELRALVGQATGERWSDVAITLSTAHPQQWTELPELHSLRIGRRQPPPPKTGWRPPPSGTELLYADYDRVRAPEPPAPPVEAAPPVRTSATMVFGAPADAGSYTRAGMLADVPEPALEYDEADDAPEGYGGAMPQPGGMSQAAAMPASAPMMMPASLRSKSAGLGSMIGGALDGLFSSGGGGGEVSKRRSAPAEREREEAEESSLGTLMADRGQLEYGSLWLPPPDDPRRGALQRADRAQRYGRLASLAPEQIATALARGEAALTQARALEQRGAPGGHHWAEGSEGFDYAYEAQSHVSLESDGDLHGLPLRACDVEASPRYISVPRETQDVFRVVVLRNPLDAPLLPGPVDVYVGGRFALASAIEVTPPRGRVELGLGVEQAIKIARNTTFEEESAGLLKRHRDLEHQVRVEVRNNLERPATIEVRERLPVTREGESDIEISERSVEPAWDEHEQHDPPLAGGRAWKVEVPAGGERTLRAAYSIRIPQNHEIVGGNRREG